MAYLGNLSTGPQDDPDADGYTNAYEQLANQDPGSASFPLVLDLSPWNDSMIRLSWPGRPGLLYQVWSGSNPTALTLLAEVPARVPESEFFVSDGIASQQYFQVRAFPETPGQP
jgi:hypothetical protein